ncbi:SDR family NAD(P)-dependent oxidoreductase [Nonomuraea sp. NPDC003560]|uniref:SDR family NAD(P)-dependent oxidoreductase n=1 Tax=Nonomuraea sp. NPDC003560 TaxID=3364341 RepID=UPI003674DD4B
MPSPDRPRQEPIAIVGVSALMPGPSGAEGFWRTVVEGRDHVRDVPPAHWLISDYFHEDPTVPDRTYARRGAFLDPMAFDPLAFGLPPATLPATDTSQLFALLAAERLLEDVEQGAGAGYDRERVSVVLGATPMELLSTMSNRLQRPVWARALRESGLPEDQAERICDRIAAHYVPWQEATFPGLLSNVVAGRVANRFDLHGANFVTDAACAASLAAVSAAISELSLRRADLVIAGGVDTLNDIVMYMCFSKTPALSPSGDCRPFAADSDGTILGEGVVLVALKRLADAERDQDAVYAVLRGLGASSDGSGTAIYAPSPEGQVRALSRAYETAGYGPETVELMEAHGTGTLAGDAAEVAALRTVFAPARPHEERWCALGSVKSQFGHTKSTAGAAGLLKAALALHHRVLPPTIKVTRPSPRLGLDSSPFYLNTATRPWIRGSGHPRRASVSSFGFGGSNFHATLEEYVPRGGGRRAPSLRVAPTELVPLTAATPRLLAARCRTLASDGPLLASLALDAQQEIAETTGTGPCVALVATDGEDLARKLCSAACALETAPEKAFTTPDGVCYSPGPLIGGRTAFLFPGQGSQYVGMGADLAVHVPEAREIWDRFAASDFDDGPLHRIVFPPPAFTDEERDRQGALLTRTEWAQPALAVHEMAMLAVVRLLGLRADCAAGHSLGELTALHAAGCLDGEALVRLTRRRGELMGGLPGDSGGMLAVQASWTEVEKAIEELGPADLWPVNHNAPDQVVVAGSRASITALQHRLELDGTPARPVAVSAAFHSPLVAAVTGPLGEFVAGLDVTAPLIDVYGNADATPYAREPAAVRERIIRQPAAPVRFAEQIEAMYERGVRTFVEVGPGSVLTRLVRANLGGRPHLAAALDRPGRHGLTALQEGLAVLVAHGVPVDLAPLCPARPRQDARRRSPATVVISGANYGKPYPPVAVPDEPVTAPTAKDRATLGTEERETRVTRAGDPRPDDTGWTAAVAEIQRQTAEVHAAYQQAMADTQMAFLATAEAAIAQLETRNGQDATPDARGHDVRRAAEASPRPAPGGTPPPPGFPRDSVTPPASGMAPAPSVEAPVESPVLSGTFERVTGPSPREAEPAPTLPPRTAPAYVPVSGAGSAPEPGPDLTALMLEVVAEKTGYPLDILSPEMQLQTDLGIDSIKRVEILAAVRSRVELPHVDAAELSRLRTLGEIADRFRRASGPAPPSAAGSVQTGDPLERAEPPPGRGEPLVRMTVAESAANHSGLTAAGLRREPLVITDDGRGVAPRLAHLLTSHGFPAAAVARVPPEARGVVFLGGLREVASREEAIEVNGKAFAAARSVAGRFSAEGGLFVTVQDTGGDFGLRGSQGERAWLGGVAALARTAAREWPKATVKSIDIEWAGQGPQAVAASIERELLAGGALSDVGLRADGRRVTLVTHGGDELSGDAFDDVLTPGSVVLVTGGGRGITGAAVRELARLARPRLLLLGRTPLVDEPGFLREARDEAAIRQLLVAEARRSGSPPPTPSEVDASARRVLARREIRATLAELARLGSAARYVAADVLDGPALTRALTEAQRDWGPVTGLMHGAGVLADELIADKSPAAFDRVFDTKVRGLDTLLTVLGRRLRFMCLFSSLAAQHGNPGQCDYAMANEVLFQVAAAQHATGLRSMALGWGPWAAGMVTRELAGRFRRRGVGLILPAAGARAFAAELAGGRWGERVLIAAGDVSRFSDTDGESRAELRVSLRTHPELRDHRIGGTSVVPMAQAIEWLAAAALEAAPGRTGSCLRDIRVVRRIAIEPHETRLLTIKTARKGGEHDLRLEISGADGLPHYLARSVDEDPRPRPAVDQADDSRHALTKAPYGGDVLFHGPLFRGLLGVGRIGTDGATGVVAGVGELGWRGEHPQVDPVAVDATIQLALVWARHTLGSATLPMGASSFFLYRPGPVRAGARCHLSARQADPDVAVCDLILLEESGLPVAELRGLSLVRRPG